MRTLRSVSGIVLALVCAAGAPPASAGPPQPTWLVVMQSASTSAQALQDAVAPLGGMVVSAYPELGTFIVAADATFRTAASALPGVSSIVPNVPLPVDLDGDTAGAGAVTESLPADEPFYPFQWGLHAIRAKGAWDAGYTGAGVRVAVLDWSFDVTHPDLAPNIQAALARSFVPGEPVTPPVGATFSHGTMVAGIIASAADGVGTVGVAPDAEIVPIKMIGDAGSFLLPWFLDALSYAVSVEADVVNMSFNVPLPREGVCFPPPVDLCFTAKDVADTARVVQRAIAVARRHGVTPVAAAGNNAAPLDRRDDVLRLPAETRGVLAVSALGPVDWALDQTTDLDVPESYTNYGKRVIAFSGPGGRGGGFPPGPICDLGLDLGAGPIPCQWFDKMLSTSVAGNYQFDAGTSYAAPSVAGVAALIIGKHGGAMSPRRVQAVLRRSADDLGPRGRDDFFGWGRVNAERAVQMTPE